MEEGIANIAMNALSQYVCLKSGGLRKKNLRVSIEETINEA
jgi:hypothetical protein